MIGVPNAFRIMTEADPRWVWTHDFNGTMDYCQYQITEETSVVANKEGDRWKVRMWVEDSYPIEPWVILKASRLVRDACIALLLRFEQEISVLPEPILPPELIELQVYEDEPWKRHHDFDNRFISWSLEVSPDANVWVSWNKDDGWAVTLTAEEITPDVSRLATNVMDSAWAEVTTRYPNGPNRVTTKEKNNG
jgi:hypothetical protein